MNSYHGYSGNNFDRWVERNSNTSTLGKVQKQFWFTKSAVIRKFGKREDEYIVASDAVLDSKIDLFKAIESSTKELQMLLADYQNKICLLAQEENTLGRLLKEYGKEDQTRAGKMMLAVGKSLSYTAQQRVALRNPLVRLFQEVDTFQTRAVEDTCRTVEEMEKIRTEYRGALMWMKNISQDFNPDHYQQLEKFREVQTLVKQKKSKFDQVKIKSLQKIELLAASRCNMFSHALILYQNNLITFSDKTAKTLNNVASNFKGYHPYKFHVIKELAEPLAPVENEDEERNEENEELELNGDDKTFFDSEYHDYDKKGDTTNSLAPAKNRANKYKKREAKLGKNSDSLINLFSEEESNQIFTFEDESKKSSEEKINSVTSFTNIDLMSEDIPTESTTTSSAEILKELFESPQHVPSEVPVKALPIFGSETLYSQSNSLTQNEEGENSNSKELSHSSHSSQLFLPSHLLDFGLSDLKSETKFDKLRDSSFKSFESQLPWKDMLSQQTHPDTSSSSSFTDSKVSDKNDTTNTNSKLDKNKLDWYKIFQDIDPLGDPGNAIFGKGFRDKQC